MLDPFGDTQFAFFIPRGLHISEPTEMTYKSSGPSHVTYTYEWGLPCLSVIHYLLFASRHNTLPCLVISVHLHCHIIPSVNLSCLTRKIRIPCTRQPSNPYFAIYNHNIRLTLPVINAIHSFSYILNYSSKPKTDNTFVCIFFIHLQKNSLLLNTYATISSWSKAYPKSSSMS